MPSSGHPARGTREPCSRDSSEGRALWVPDTNGAARPSLGPHCAGFPATQRPRGPAHSCPEFEDASRPPHVSADLGQPGGATSPEVKAASWGHSSRSVGAGRSEVQAKDTGLRGPQMGLGRAPAGPARAHGARCSDTSIHPSRDVGVQLSGPTRGAEGGLPGRRGWGQQGPRSRRAGPGPRVREIPAQRRVARPQALGLRPTAPRSPWRRQSRRSSLERQACGPVLGRSCLTAPALGFSPDPPARLAKRMTSARIPQAPSSPALPGSPGLSVEQAFLGAGAPLSHLCLPGGSRPWDEPAPPAGSRAPRPPKPISRLPSQRPSGLGRLGHDTLGDLGPGLPACTRGGDCRGPLGTK